MAIATKDHPETILINAQAEEFKGHPETGIEETSEDGPSLRLNNCRPQGEGMTVFYEDKKTRLWLQRAMKKIVSWL